MTRENKLALVVGFGLLLFVGILVSDHFSAAHRQDKANVASRGSESRERLRGPVTIAEMPAAAATTATGLKPEPMAVAAADVAPASTGVVPIASDRRGERAAVAVVETASRSGSARPVVDAGRQESEPGVKLRPIADGESLYSICKQEYGDGSLSEALARYNKSVVPDPRRIRKGVTIRLPSVETLKGGKPSRTPAASGVPALAATDVIQVESGEADAATRKPEVVAAAEPQASQSGRIYVVRKGDTLAAIAQRELGSRGRWKDIVAANAGSLKDPAALSPGMKIRIPARS